MGGCSARSRGAAAPRPDAPRIRGPVPDTGRTAITGSVDGLGRGRAHGWAHDGAHPNAPVSILVTARGQLLGRTVANRFRPDLVAAGIGDGRFGFDLTFDPPLSPVRSSLVHFRSEATGAELPGSPMRLPASREFDATARRSVSAMLHGFGSDAELENRIAFLTAEREALLRRQADRARLRPALSRRADESTRPLGLVVDHAFPTPDRDGGSVAIVSHMRALRRLGFTVLFAAAAMDGSGVGPAAEALAADGVTPCHPPGFATVEDVLRRNAGRFDLVYVHRVSVCAAYAALIRQTQPRARLVFAVADLHHLRLMLPFGAGLKAKVLASRQRV